MITLKRRGAYSGTRVFGTETYWVSYWVYEGWAKWWYRFYKKRAELHLPLDYVSAEGEPRVDGTNPMDWFGKFAKGAVSLHVDLVLIMRADGSLTTVNLMQVKFSKLSDAMKFKIHFPKCVPCE